MILWIVSCDSEVSLESSQECLSSVECIGSTPSEHTEGKKQMTWTKFSSVLELTVLRRDGGYNCRKYTCFLVLLWTCQQRNGAHHERGRNTGVDG